MKLNIKYLPNYAAEWDRLRFAKPEDAGMDLRAAISETIVLEPNERAIIPNGIACEMQAPTSDYEIQIRPRSGLAAKNGITIVNSPATIDWAYRGELMTILLNTGTQPFAIHAGDRIAQMVICPIIRPEVIEVQDLSDSVRGDSGFGSSGV